ncbi:MAG: hypothetical protein M3O67_10095 [Bacteroidota bacterium]|nr:hypothetical protein [Bacteroidota bacterium]
MSTFIKDEIGFAVNTKTAFYTDSGKTITTTKDSPFSLSTADWFYWGDNNDEPALIADDIENCPVLSAGVEAEARLAVGRGIDAFLMVDKKPDGTEELEWVSDSEVLDFLEDNCSFENSYRNIYNMLGYGLGATQFILSKNRKRINRISVTDVYKLRLEKRDKYGDINNMFLCGDWQNASGKVDNDVIKKVPLLHEGYELDDLTASKSGFEFAILHRLLRNGRGYYPRPLHRSAKAWVDLTRSIPAIKNAIFKNQMEIKYVVIIADTYWKRMHKTWDSYAPEKRKAILQEKYDEINLFLTGELNAGKSIIAGKYFDPISKTMVPDIEINVIDDKQKDGKLLPDSAAGEKRILFSMFANPAIFGSNLLGDGASGGAGSGSDIREATLVLMNLLDPERRSNLKMYNLVKKFNEWDKRLEVERTIFPVTSSGNTAAITIGKKMTPRLVFRYSNAILTTLDTGGSTKPVTN